MLPEPFCLPDLERGEMAKKKAEEKPKPRQEVILVYKADVKAAPEFRQWLEELAADIGIPVTATVDMALKALGAQRKFRPMPKRLVR
jgi:hypothetical protein